MSIPATEFGFVLNLEALLLLLLNIALVPSVCMMLYRRYKIRHSPDPRRLQSKEAGGGVGKACVIESALSLSQVSSKSIFEETCFEVKLEKERGWHYAC